MFYQNITTGIFIKRINRFIAHIEIDGLCCACHVKNTGRLRELLVPGASVIAEKHDNPARKTNYSLIAVYKGNTLINIDSQAPNKAVHEWLSYSGFFPDISLIRPEYTYGNSRLDFYIEAAGRKILMEVKGVTLEHNGIAMFPDAPSLRAVKHIEELGRAGREGYEAYILLVIQMKGVTGFMPNRTTHPAFADALEKAFGKGVRVHARDCLITGDSMILDKEIPVCFS